MNEKCWMIFCGNSQLFAKMPNETPDFPPASGGGNFCLIRRPAPPSVKKWGQCALWEGF
jgi:hypothetical protein